MCGSVQIEILLERILKQKREICFVIKLSTQKRQFNLMSPVCSSLLAITCAALSLPVNDKISMWLHGTCFECLCWSISIHVIDEVSPRGLRQIWLHWFSIDECSVLCCQLWSHIYWKTSWSQQCSSLYCRPGSQRREDKHQYWIVSSNSLVDLWEPGTNLVLQPHLHCVCACHAQWAFSHPLQAAVVLS